MDENQGVVSSFNLNEFSKKSEEYFAEIKSELEVKYKGKYAALDFESKQYWLGETASEALAQAKSQHPTKLFYLVQVGSAAAYSIQSMISNHSPLFSAYDTQW